MALFIIFLLLGLANIGYFMYSLYKFTNSKVIGQDKLKIEGTNRIKFLVMSLGQGVLTIFSSIGLMLMSNWSLNPGEIVLLIFSSYFLGTFFSLLAASFYLNYWCLNLDEEQRKVNKIVMYATAVLFFVALWAFSESFAKQDIYPLLNRIDFKYGLVNDDTIKSGFGVQFYGIVIVFGALICYFITNHAFYKKFGEHGIVDTLFIVSFLAGVIGARLWSCLVLDFDIYVNDPIRIITGIGDGGLAIHGGIYVGVSVGVVFVLLFRKYIDPRYAMDVAIPSILLAQSIGRWGNFFNQEVYGLATNSPLLNILPTIVRNNIFIDGEYVVPLFLIESVINFAGYFVIRYLFGRVFKLREGLGYQASLYFVWYGVVRVFMEPLRNAQFEYGVSIRAAKSMIVVGVVMIVGFTILHFVRKSKGLEDQFGEKITQK